MTAGITAKWFDAVRKAFPADAPVHPATVEVGEGTPEDLADFALLLAPLGNVSPVRVGEDRGRDVFEIRVDPSGLRLLLHATFADRAQVAGTVACTTHGPRTLNLLAAVGGVYCAYENAGVFGPSALSVLRLVQLVQSSPSLATATVVHLQQGPPNAHPAVAELVRYATASSIVVSADVLQSPSNPEAGFSGAGITVRPFSHRPRTDDTGDEAGDGPSINIVLYVSMADFAAADRDELRPGAGIGWLRALPGSTAPADITDARAVEAIRCKMGLGPLLWDGDTQRFAIAQWTSAYAVTSKRDHLLGVVLCGRRPDQCGCFGDPTFDVLSETMLCAFLEQFWRYKPLTVVPQDLPAGDDLESELGRLRKAGSPFVLRLSGKTDVAKVAELFAEGDVGEPNSGFRLEPKEQRALQELLDVVPEDGDRRVQKPKARLWSLLRESRNKPALVVVVGVAALVATAMVTDTASTQLAVKALNSTTLVSVRQPECQTDEKSGLQVCTAEAVATEATTAAADASADTTAVQEAKTAVQQFSEAAFSEFRNVCWNAVRAGLRDNMNTMKHAEGDFRQLAASAPDKGEVVRGFELLERVGSATEEIRTRVDQALSRGPVRQAMGAVPSTIDEQTVDEVCQAHANLAGKSEQQVAELCRVCGTTIQGMLDARHSAEEFHNAVADKIRDATEKMRAAAVEPVMSKPFKEAVEMVKDALGKGIDAETVVSYLGTCGVQKPVGNTGQWDFAGMCDKLREAETDVWKVMERLVSAKEMEELNWFEDCFESVTDQLHLSCSDRYRLRLAELGLHSAWVRGGTRRPGHQARPPVAPNAASSIIGGHMKELRDFEDPLVYKAFKNGDVQGIMSPVKFEFHTFTHNLAFRVAEFGSGYEDMKRQHPQLGKPRTDSALRIFHIGMLAQINLSHSDLQAVNRLAQTLSKDGWDGLVISGTCSLQNQQNCALVQNLNNGRTWSSSVELQKSVPENPTELAIKIAGKLDELGKLEAADQGLDYRVLKGRAP